MVRSLSAFLFILISCLPCLSQSISEKVVDQYDISNKRLLAISTGINLYMMCQGQIDLDSAMLLSCDAYKFSRLLPYNEGYDNGRISSGQSLIDSGLIEKAKLQFNRLAGDDQIRLAIQLGTYYLFKPGTVRTDLDQSLRYIRQAQRLAIRSGKPLWKNECLSLLAKYHTQTGQILISQRYFSNVVLANVRANDKKGTALAAANQAINLPMRHSDKIGSLQKAKTLCKQAGLKTKEIEILSNIIVEYFISDWKLARVNYLELIRLQKASGFLHTHLAENGIGYIDDVQGSYVSALAHSLEAVKTMEKTGDTKFSALFYPRLASIYFHMDRKEGLTYYLKSIDNRSKETQLFWYKSFIACAGEMIKYYGGKKALEFLTPIQNKFPPLTLFDKMNLYLVRGYCYADLKQDRRASYFFDLFTEMAKQFPPEFIYAEIPFAYLRIAEFYSGLGDQSRTKLYLAKVKPFLPSKGNMYFLCKLDLINFRLDSLNKNYKSAIKNYQLFKEKSDSNLTLAASKQITFMQVQYDSRNKDASINSLTQQGELKQVELRRSQYVRIVASGGVVLLLVIAGLLCYQFLENKRSNEKLQLQRFEVYLKNRSLEQLLEEKQGLLKEVHHRVKNNLHTVMSLLESQAAFLANDALSAVQDSQHRIQAMSLIHQKLYASDNITTIQVSIYIRELVGYLRDSFANAQKIRFQLEVDPIELDVAQAIPLGLILNEALTNALKYAFPDGRSGSISIAFKHLDNRRFTLSITDDGIGFRPNNFQDEDTLHGIRLMNELCNKMQANLNINTIRGTSISLVFFQNQKAKYYDKIS
ncbi:sensor histidine kinase [Dyadobacter psychrotolerans]|uniref:histidine kinase n=1 Tax=Dyadobacter psychrotolerans TaxID=2541721 RepID=A0A4R5DAR9_9BACT|nr:sensor histidine kinase [Dyadobacter psychrotolerans]TDE10752.1 sensor histidine kinase [Dyadobacter psychrotolerans]